MADVEVIGVGTTTLLSTTTTDETGAQTTEEIPKTILTLSLDQKDAEKVILAKKQERPDPGSDERRVRGRTIARHLPGLSVQVM